MDVVKDFEEKEAKPKIFGVPPNKTEDKKVEKQHPTASTHIHDNRHKTKIPLHLKRHIPARQLIR